MSEYIDRHDALKFDAEIAAGPDDIQLISKGMALYAEHIKGLPVVQTKRRDLSMFFFGLFLGSVLSAMYIALAQSGKDN